MLMLCFENAYKALVENSDDTCGNIIYYQVLKKLKV